jgi:aldehyde dehydrogenase (NAD+)
MVLKPSELTPSSASIFAEILDQVGFPPGVFNLVHGSGTEVGAALAEHADVDMISFTGSTRAGIDVARRAAPTVKRVGQELGGKSPNIILESANFEEAVKGGARFLFNNAGQSCAAPSRMLVPISRLKDAAAIAKRVADDIKIGDPRSSDTQMGPVVSETQWTKIQVFISSGIDEGAKLVAGGPGRPSGINRGYFVRPTVFADVTSDMHIAREEIFGPVLAIIGYSDTAEAITMANDTPYGLSGYVSAGTVDEALAVARQIRAGTVNINGAMFDRAAPFGGYKQSGNGREWGKFGLEDFLEVKAIAGAA